MEQREGLIEVASRFLPGLKKNGTEAHSTCPFHDDDKESLRVGETWRCLACSAQDEHGGDASGFLQSFLGCTADEAERRLSNGSLPDPQPIEQAKLIRPPFFGLRQVLDRPNDKIWVHTLAAAVQIAREMLPERVHIGLIQGRAWDDLGLPPARHCVLLPTNSDTAMAIMDKLHARLVEAGHTVRIIDPSDQEPHWTLMDAHASGMTHDEILTWAKKRTRPQPTAAPKPEPAPTIALAGPPASGAASEIAQDAPGRAESLDLAPDKAMRAKPALAVVEGNTLRAPKQAEDPDQLPAFSEFALSRRFVDGIGQDWRYTAAWATWARWDGKRWWQDDRKGVTWAVQNCCKAALEDHAKEASPAQRLKLLTLKTVNAVIGLASADPRIATGSEEWDADPWLLGTPAGIVDLRTGELAPPDKNSLISKATSVAPEAGPHPLFDMVIARPARGDADMLSFLWRWLGYMLTGDVREERFIFLHGVGGSGKGTLVKVLADLLADYARAISVQAFTESQQQRHSQEIAKLQGARFVYASETEEGSRFDESLLKWLTGRDKVSAHKMRQDDIEFYPQFKLLIYGNNRPSLKSVGEEMRRRIDLIEFPGTIPEEERDTSLKDRLRAEYPAILASMIRSCLDWQQSGGLGKPEAVSSATENYLRMNDILGDFIEDCLDIQQDSYSPSGQAYKRFQSYCSDRGERYVMAQRTFSQRMEARGYALGKIGGARIIRGVKVRGADTDPRERAGWMPDD